MKKRQPLYQIGDAINPRSSRRARYIIRNIQELKTFPEGRHLCFMYGCSFTMGAGNVMYTVMPEHTITGKLKDSGYAITPADTCKYCAHFSGDGDPCKHEKAGTYAKCDACIEFIKKED